MASKHKPLSTFSIILFLIAFSFLTFNYTNEFQIRAPSVNPDWLDFVSQQLGVESLNIATVNVEMPNSVKVRFDPVDRSVRWADLFPSWLKEDAPAECPKIPMPKFEDYEEVDVVVARVPCGENGLRDVYRLQVNLVVANLLVRSGRRSERGVFVVFIGSCEAAMWEIFRCEDLMLHVGEIRVYKPELGRIREKVSMPVGTCQLSPPFHKISETVVKPREAYVSVLHSSDDYVCGAIALAQSIILSNSTKDLLLLVDDHVSLPSVAALRSAGWKIKLIKRVHNPTSQKNSYNEWNYTKLRAWQLTRYDKLIFIDSDFIITRNLDKFFAHAQLSAVGNHVHYFNSGLMVLEPSSCTFEALMQKRSSVVSYNGGDQGFLNEVFTWWHRLPRAANTFKYFEGGDEIRRAASGAHALHFFGLKPWKCYRDYDCNWDRADLQNYASDDVNKRWWEVYDTLPDNLKKFCGPTPEIDARIRMHRDMAKNDRSFGDEHWKIKVEDPRQIIHV